MKTLKLEVGKTYRNRNGEEVKIIEKIGKGYWRCGGNNSKWYTESGGWDVCGAEHPEDLIEEVPETRHTFTIPDGVKEVTVEQVGNRIVVDMVPEKEPKPGDVSKSLPIKKYEIDFGGHLLAGLEITNNEPTVIGAMNGWGDGISNDEITITEK